MSLSRVILYPLLGFLIIGFVHSVKAQTMVQINAQDLAMLQIKSDSLPLKNRRITDLEDMVNNKDAQIRNLTTAKNQIEFRANQAEQTRDSLVRALDAQRRIANDFQTLAQRNQADADKVRTCRDSIGKLNGHLAKIPALQEQNELLNKEILSARASIDSLQAQLQREQSNVTRLERKTQQQQQEIDQFNTALKDKDTRIAQLSEMVGKLKISIIERVRGIVGTYTAKQYDPVSINELKQQMDMVIQYASPGQEQQEARELRAQLQTYENLAKAIQETDAALAKDFDELVVNDLTKRLNNNQLNINSKLNAEKQNALNKLNGYRKFYQDTYFFFDATKGFSQKNMLDASTDYLRDEAGKLADYPFLLGKVQYLKDHPGDTSPQHRMPLRRLN